MNELDADALREVRDWAQKRLDAHERRMQLQPVLDAFMHGMRDLTAKVVPDTMAGPRDRVRKSVLALEWSLEEYPERAREAEAKVHRVLEAARRRTESLERWLKELS